MKRALIIGIIMFCVHQMNAQTTPCEKMFSKAINYYEAKDYTNAKAQFQKVVNNCDSNKELAQEYIKLCNGWIGLDEEKRLAKEQNKSVLDADAQKINKLEQKNRELEGKNAKYVEAINNTSAAMKMQDSIMNAKTDTIRMAKKEKADLCSSLKELGKELNTYLQNPKKKKKNQLVSCDTINEASKLIEVMRLNLGMNTNSEKEIKNNKK